MTQNLRIAVLWAFCALFAVSSIAQDRTLVGTVVDVDETRNRLQIRLDNAEQSVFTVEADAVTTTFHGFGTEIAGKPEVFVGSQGFSNVREGDRLEIRGPMRSGGLYTAQRVTLVGRSVAASPVGVGQTRDPQRDVSTPTGPRTGDAARTTGGRVEGVIRQVNEREGRIVIQTTAGRMMTVRTGRNTPVFYRGEQYRVENLEVGDRVRVEADPRSAAADDIAATRIDVTMSVQEAGGAMPGSRANVTVLEGRVTRVEPGLDYIYVDEGRGTEVRVDMRQAEDARGDVLRARDVRVGDRVEITGSLNRVGDMFLASTVRFDAADTPVRDTPVGGGVGGTDFTRPALVTITGTVTETLDDAATIGLRDRDTNAVLRIWAVNELVVRTKGTTTTSAGALRAGDTAIIQAFRDASGNLIAQTIRLRNR